MLHELLLALVGCTGDVFIDADEEDRRLGFKDGSRHYAQDDPDGASSDECTFRIAPDLQFLRPSEREILERLLRLGFYYRELDRFALKSRNLSWIGALQDSKAVVQQHSVYQRAVANGVTEVLAKYRSAVLTLEKNILADPLPVLAIVTQCLKQFDLLLPPLHALVREVESKKLRGGKLLNFLHERSHCGIPELQTWIQRLLWQAHQVMYRQLSGWMVYGLLQDQNQEFFISRYSYEQAKADIDASEPPANKSKSGRGTEDANMIDWHTGYCVRLDMLPDYIQLPVAESILFVGKAVRVLRNPSASSSLTKQYSFSGAYEGPELLPKEEAEKIGSLLRELQERPLFHKLSFERSIDSIRTIAATHLWKLVVVHADLVGHLKAFKDYFLLAKGDFFQCFLEESRSLMKLPPRPSTAEADLKAPFQQAAVKTIGDEDKYFSRVTLRMPLLANSGLPPSQMEVKQRSSIDALSDIAVGPSYDGWDGIALEYSIDWPLQLLFNREVLAKYSKVFQYLLRLKRIQLELEKSWAKAMQRDRRESRGRQKNHKKDDPKVSGMPTWRLRQHMAYLITNLQFYIQVDVIESQWNLLQERVQASKDFTELARFHQEYLSALISQSFLDIGSVSRILDSIIKLCLQLCRIMEHQDATSSSTAAELDQITEEFNKKSNSLYTILRSSKLAGSQRAPFLRQFLLRLNYNSFFESTARGALNVIRPRLPSASTTLH
ncbi:hypothetical protein SELMODRAFT_77770 [Selaginella moellendorffii]|uniref:Gamma-tubulin complex component n=1 Tax=Selaginella moellendorffii TaxID=88036 RepID=D8QRE9_SELML|nr:hypothetical protein SELMODRAFT_77770 [Selaginella moellendorffii]